MRGSERAGRVIGWDSSHYVSPEFALWMKSHGHRFVIRYLRRTEQVDDEPRERWPVYLSRQELDDLLGVGVGVGLTQVFIGREMITREDGERAGRAMAANARALGAPSNVTLWCDAEWSDSRAQEADQVAYINGWSAAVAAAGFDSIGIYVGANIGLTGEGLYGLKRYTRYWKALSRVPTVYPRGFCLTQSWEYEIRGTRPETWSLIPWSSTSGSNGKRIDLNVSSIDSRGGQWRYLTK